MASVSKYACSHEFYFLLYFVSEKENPNRATIQKNLKKLEKCFSETPKGIFRDVEKWCKKWILALISRKPRSPKDCFFEVPFGTISVKNSRFWQFCMNIWAFFLTPSVRCGTTANLLFFYFWKIFKNTLFSKTLWITQMCSVWKKKLLSTFL